MLTWKQKRLFIGACVLAGQFGPASQSGLAQDSPLIQISNDIMAVQANSNGRFNLGTAAGTTLTFRYPDAPSTSHTHFRVDGKVYRDRPPAFISLRQVDASIICAWKIKDVAIVQRLALEQYGATSGAVFIQYLILNQDDRAHRVGVLLELDTMVNHNDRAPISTSFGYSTSARAFHAPRIPDFFQAFEKNPVTPGLIARGTMKGREAVAPDLFIIGDWHRLKTVVWDYSATNTFYGDSAVILRWDERRLQPGEHRQVGTYYGIADVVIKKGLLSLNVTAPERLENIDNRLSPNPFDVVLIITNTAASRASGIEAEITLPAGLRLIGGESPRKRLQPGSLTIMQSGQIAWRVFAEAAVSPQPLEYSIDVHSANIGASTISSTIAIPGPGDSPFTRKFDKLPPAVRNEIRAFAADAVTAQRIDPKRLIEQFNKDGHEIQFFPLGYYRPFLARNLENYRAWANKNSVAPDYVARIVGDQQSPPYLDYLFNEVALNLNPILKSLSKGDSTNLSLTLSFEGFTDHRPVTRIIYDNRAVDCNGNTIAGFILDNRQLACLRAYFTKEELVKYMKERSEPYFSQLVQQRRISFKHDFFGYNGISPESLRIRKASDLSDSEREKKYSEIRRTIISLSFEPLRYSREH